MTSTYANSKSVHGALRRALSPWFAANVFHAQSCSRGGSRYIALWRAGCKPGADIWLPYYSVVDLDCWVDFLLPGLAHLLLQSEAS